MSSKYFLASPISEKLSGLFVGCQQMEMKEGFRRQVSEAGLFASYEFAFVV